VQGGNSKYGPQIKSVATGGPADLAGVQKGDVVMSVNGRTITNAADLRAEVRVRWPKQKLAIVVSRAGASVPLEVIATAAPQPPEPINYRPRVTPTTLASALIGS